MRPPRFRPRTRRSTRTQVRSSGSSQVVATPEPECGVRLVAVVSKVLDGFVVVDVALVGGVLAVAQAADDEVVVAVAALVVESLQLQLRLGE